MSVKNNKRHDVLHGEDYDGTASKGNPEFSKFMATTAMDMVHTLVDKANELDISIDDEVPEIVRQLKALILAISVVSSLKK